MYSVSKDIPHKIIAIPQSSVGAPCPVLLAGEHSLVLAYYLEEASENKDGTSVRVVSESEGNEPCMVVEFQRPLIHMFGPPNDEAFQGHPLAVLGLTPYSVFEIENSSWLQNLERMNSCHPHHKSEHFAKYKHFIFAFHDTTFECIAEGFDFSLCRGSVRAALLNTYEHGARQ